MQFRYRKLYADLVTPDGTVAVVYLTWLEVAGLRRASAGAELYHPDGRREVRRACRPFAAMDPAGTGAPDLIRLTLPDGELTLEYAVERLPRSEPPTPPARGMRWLVLTPRAEGVLRLPSEPARRGTGYVDWVELARPPRRLGLATLEWGRLHPSEGAVVFTALTFRSGRAWRWAAVWVDGASPRPDDHCTLTRTGQVVQVGLSGEHGRTRGPYHLMPLRTLHAGPALDRRRLPGVVERTAARLFAGRVHESRWLSRVDVPARDTASPPALHERVVFDPWRWR